MRAIQVKLLRVLQSREFHRIGETEPRSFSGKVIAATHRSLEDAIAAGRFREDLYYRLRVLPIRIPPLRERPADIAPLAQRFARLYGGAECTLTGRAAAVLASHSWPGNVRELQNALQRAAILAMGRPIDVEHLHLEPALRQAARVPEAVAGPLEDAERQAIRSVLERTGGNRNEAAAALGISPRTLRHKLKQYRDAGSPLSWENAG